jgi:hypothetical protein
LTFFKLILRKKDTDDEGSSSGSLALAGPETDPTAKKTATLLSSWMNVSSSLLSFFQTHVTARK